jgi:fructose-bisphosphate aldolase class II
LKTSAHGTDELPDEYWPKMIAQGVTKINVNSWNRDPYAAALSKGLANDPFPDATENATELFAQECAKWIKRFGSDGKA